MVRANFFWSRDLMLVDFLQLILDWDGDPIKGPDGKTDMTLKSASQFALGARFQDEASMPFATQVERYKLGKKIGVGSSPVEITIDEAKQIKDLVSKAYP
jgi:hypothetical protein